MKKLMTIGLAAAVLFAMAGQAKATALETSGELRARAWYVKNYVSDKRTTEWMDERLRLNLVWPVAEGVKVNVRADVSEGMWGTARPEIAFDHVNMQFAWPGAPLAFTVGRQDVTWGPGYFAKSDNRDRFKVIAKFAPTLSLGLMYDKSTEIFADHDNPNGADDARGYTLAAFGAASGWSYGALVGYSINEVTPTTGSGVTKRIAADGFVMGKAGPVDLKVEVAYITGNNQVNGAAKVDVSGMGAYVSAALPAGPVTIALEGAYAAGDDPKTAKLENGFRADYQSPFWSIILYNNLDYPGMLTGPQKGGENLQTSTSPGADFGVSNAAATKLSFTMSPAKGVTFILAGVYATSLQDVIIGTTTYSGSLGTEFDAVAVLNITDNVYFLGGVGYLVAGDFFGNVDNPLGVMGSLNVKF